VIGGDDARAIDKVAELYADALSEVDVELPAPAWEGGIRGWFVYVVTLPESVDRDSVIHSLRADGIDCKPYLPALHLMPHLAQASGAVPGEFPVTEAAGSRGLALPFFPELTEPEVARVAQSLAAAMTNAPGA
ncbi:MAG: DegT/DnrJ/EryC1/StrS family aminotransferase, partial [Actinomycetes bacterium]